MRTYYFVFLCFSKIKKIPKIKIKTKKKMKEKEKEKEFGITDITYA